jgi:hypothetical protein
MRWAEAEVIGGWRGCCAYSGSTRGTQSVGKLQRPLDRLEPRLAAQRIEERFGLEAGQAGIAQLKRLFEKSSVLTENSHEMDAMGPLLTADAQ